jgi:chitinase
MGCALLVVACGSGGATGGDGGGGVDGAVDGAVGNDGGGGPDGSVASGNWVMGYYAGYESQIYPVDAIDWANLTHVAVAFYLPHPDATIDEQLFLDPTSGPALGHAIVDAAHKNGRKAIASVGGAGVHAAWVGAPNLADYGYDGIDFDWEPVDPGDAPALTDLVKQVRAAAPSALLTIPVGYINANKPDDVSLYAKLAPDLDQINLMTYGMAGAYQGWKSWHSSALYHQDTATPTSIDSSIKAYVMAGVPKRKLGVGAGFYGLCYSAPVSAPRQALGGSTIVADDGKMSYAHIVGAYPAAARKWDPDAHVPYLSFTQATGPEGCEYVTYEDPQSLADKGAYIKAQGLGGTIVWTINQGYVSSAQPGQKNPLLAALGASTL